MYDNGYKKNLSTDLVKKSSMDEISDEHMSSYADSSFEGISKAAIEWSDGIIIGSENVSSDVIDFAKSLDKPVLDYVGPEEFVDVYSEFYDQIMAEDGVFAG